VLVTLTERRRRLTLIASTNTKKGAIVCATIVDLLKPYQNDLHTITYDNGKEFADHEKVAESLRGSCYFANPYSSWERGLNENHNGLIRQYLPKKLPFDDVSNDKAAIFRVVTVFFYAANAHLFLWVKRNAFDGLPVSCATWPAIGVESFRSLIDLFAFLK
jgi:hypothetical protein